MTIEQVGIAVGLVVLVAGIVGYLLRQRGGDGPPVGDIPRPLRSLVNAWYGLNRWPIPFDRDGELIPVEQRERAR
jgi:hypothetical protein